MTGVLLLFLVLCCSGGLVAWAKCVANLPDGRSKQVQVAVLASLVFVAPLVAWRLN